MVKVGFGTYIIFPEDTIVYFIVGVPAPYDAMVLEDENEKNEVLYRATCGSFWQKFRAISGLFAVVDYYYTHDENKHCFRHIFENGSEELINLIKSKG